MVILYIYAFSSTSKKVTEECSIPDDLIINEPDKHSEEDEGDEEDEGLSAEEKAIFRERKKAEREFNNGEKIICTICRKVFKTNFELQRHFRSHGLAFLKTSNNPG